MQAKAHWFLRLSLFLYGILGGLTLLLSLEGLLFREGILYAALFLMMACFLVRYAGRERLTAMPWERITAAGLIITAALLRLLCILFIPLQPESDYGVYMRTAELLTAGTLAKDPVYAPYIACAPHVLGYPALLQMVFRLAGISVRAAQLTNWSLDIISLVLMWRCGRQLAGKKAGLIALFLWGFWPSAVLYSPFTGAEPLFNCLLLLALYVFLKAWQSRNTVLCVLLLTVVGLLLALAGAVRPMSLIMLIAALLCLVTGGSGKAGLGAWLRQVLPRCGALLLGFLLMSGCINCGVEKVLERKTVSGLTASGYSLMVGMNQASDGMWSEQDSEMRLALEQSMEADEAMSLCLQEAGERFRSMTPGELLQLLVRKFRIQWGNDRFVTEGLAWYLPAQGNGTPVLLQLIRLGQHLTGIWYSLVLLLALRAIPALKQRWQPMFILPLFWLGTAALHMATEVQNRYHFILLPVMVLLAAVGFTEGKASEKKE